jgi:hypothetical protein
MKIAEPRVFRLLQFGVYICLGIAGVGVLLDPPALIQDVLGSTLPYVFGSFVTMGAILGAIAVLPGIWWLERVSLLALGTGLLMYIVIVVTLGSSIVSIILYIAFLLTFIQRWTEIRSAALAPRED